MKKLEACKKTELDFTTFKELFKYNLAKVRYCCYKNL